MPALYINCQTHIDWKRDLHCVSACNHHHVSVPRKEKVLPEYPTQADCSGLPAIGAAVSVMLVAPVVQLPSLV